MTSPTPPPTARHPRRRAATAGTALAASAALALTPALAADAHPGRGGTDDVRVWVTTPDGTQRLTEQAPTRFTTGSSTRTTITIDPATTYQTMDGFGGALTDSTAAVLYQLSPAERTQAMRDLFSPSDGIGVSFLRQPVGSSDFTAASEHYT